jgi:small subunit ribosomal protein S20
VPNTRSAAKMMRVAERRRQRNRAVKSAVKTYIRKAERGIDATVEEATPLVVQAVQSLDKAASKGVLHRKNAARRKSRLMKKLHASLAPAAEPTPAKPAKRASSRTGTKSGGRTSTRSRTVRKA